LIKGIVQDAFRTKISKNRNMTSHSTFCWISWFFAETANFCLLCIF